MNTIEGILAVNLPPVLGFKFTENFKQNKSKYNSVDKINRVDHKQLDGVSEWSNFVDKEDAIMSIKKTSLCLQVLPGTCYTMISMEC